VRTFKNFWIHLWTNIIHHKLWIIYYGFSFAFRLMWRCIIHDFSKLRPCELKGFIKNIHNLRDSTYGSDEYYQALKEIEEPINHHYMANRHHPEHFFFNEDDDASLSQEVLRERTDLSEMNLIDLVEMYIDWEAAVKKHDKGDISKSIEINSERFKASETLSCVFENTVGKL